jgi:hypothetical protein
MEELEQQLQYQQVQQPMLAAEVEEQGHLLIIKALAVQEEVEVEDQVEEGPEEHLQKMEPQEHLIVAEAEAEVVM